MILRPPLRFFASPRDRHRHVQLQSRVVLSPISDSKVKVFELRHPLDRISLLIATFREIPAVAFVLFTVPSVLPSNPVVSPREYPFQGHVSQRGEARFGAGQAR
jgi:hypothetical protein